MMLRIEVFKTNISSREQANLLVEAIQQTYSGYKANVDLDDCDKVLRIVCSKQIISISSFTDWLQMKGCVAEVLPD